MKKITFTLLFIVLVTSTSLVKAQFNPYTDKTNMLTVGIGFSGWGIPLFGRFEAPVMDNITVGGGISYQGYSETYTGVKWRHSIIGLTVRGSYHFNELIELPDEWDLYAGLGLGYYFWNTDYDGPAVPFDYSGSGAGGFSLGIHVGGRYFVSDKIGINLEFGGGTVLSGGTLGVTFLL
ncbi:MAG: outer membrane beta-barrel protein [Cyclobacteriaceae bacterium]|nr:outer membrane beta-barrel protein [Cyclobacteriaceae bacterium]